MSARSDPLFPLSRPLEAAAVGEAGLRQTIEADESERRALATSWGVPGVEQLSADLLIRREGARGLHVTGTMTSLVRQICVVTLEEFETAIAEPLDARFRPQADIDAEGARRAKIPAAQDEDEPDVPDPIVNGRIDLGFLVAEHLALALDPYPKKPGATFVEPEPEPAAVDVEASPFAVLARLKPS